jgi:hypothetical protein
MPLKACTEVHRAGVVECAIFATRNSLKSHMSRKLKSPFSNIRAVTLRLCTRSSPTAARIHPLLGLRGHSIFRRARRTSTYPFPRFPPLEVFVRRPPESAAPFARGRHPKTFTLDEFHPDL